MEETSETESHITTKTRLKKATNYLLITVILIGSIYFWLEIIQTQNKRIASNGYLGRLAKPTEPALIDPVLDLIAPKVELRPMKMTHIPRIKEGATMLRIGSSIFGAR